MSATREQLLATLAELHRELSEIGPLDGDARLQLRGTLAEIQHAIDRPSERSKGDEILDENVIRQSPTDETTIDPAIPAGPRSSTTGSPEFSSRSEPAAPLTQRLSDAARELETTHPQLSIAIGNVIDGLARMGI